MIDDRTIQAAMRGDAEAARACTEAGVALPCAHCMRIPSVTILTDKGDPPVLEIRNVDLPRYMGDCFIVCECGVGVSASTEAEAISIWNIRAPLQPEPNEPITLSEVRDMDGQPVWISYPYDAGGEWAIVNADEECLSLRGGVVEFCEIDEDTATYRRPPEGAKE